MKTLRLLLLLIGMNVIWIVADAQPVKKVYSTRSSRAITLFEDADTDFELQYYARSMEKLEKAISIDENFYEAYLKYGEVCIERKDWPKAAMMIHHVLNRVPDFNPYAYFQCAACEFHQGHYEEAKRLYLYMTKYDSIYAKMKDQIEDKVKRCDFGIQAMANPVPFNPTNLGPNINTKYADYSPSLTADEKVLIYTMLVRTEYDDPRVPPKWQEDMFISFKNDSNKWTLSQNFAPLNTDDNEGAHTISADGLTMVYTACNREGGLGSCDLYIAKRVGSRWSKPRNMGSPINSDKWESQPSLSSDGKTLYFVSNRGGGYGKMDIWRSVLQADGRWSKPENAGPEVNTKGNETYPSIHPDNHTLYFASDELIGMGGVDLFVSRRKTIRDTWGKPVNLGYPINTWENENGLIVNAKGSLAYLASDRLGGQGKLDIFSFPTNPRMRPEPVTYVRGHVFDEESKVPLEARFELIDVTNEELVTQAYSNRGNGEFLVCLPINHVYALNVSKEGYMFYSANFQLDNPMLIDTTYRLEIPLQPIKIGSVTILKNIFFEFDSFNLKPESNAELNKLIDFLKKNPTIKIEIGGHTDNKGNKDYNKTLSENRSKSVMDYLTSHGIEAARLQYKGYGMDKPIDTNDTETGRATNRRTEFMIIQ